MLHQKWSIVVDFHKIFMKCLDNSIKFRHLSLSDYILDIIFLYILS
jgi:hypothetical protein